MQWFEQMAISIVLGILHQVVKNPAKQAELRGVLLTLADDIYTSYAIAPPAHN